MAETARDRPTAKGIALALIVGCVLAILAAEGILRLAMPHWREFYSGWFMQTVDVPNHGRVATGRPGFDGHFAQNNGDFRVRIRINGFGLRNPEPVDNADGNVWFVGDSMTFGWGVEQRDIYAAVAGRLLDVPIYNVASPGTNVCGYQALVARMPPAVRPRAVVVGLILENDIIPYDCEEAARKAALRANGQGNTMPMSARGLKRFLMKHTALYNFLAISLKRVAFVRDALGALGLIAKEHAYTRVLTEGGLDDAVERTAAELHALAAGLPPGTPFAVLIAPARFEIRDGDPFFRRLREHMGQALQRRGIAVIDPIKEFRAAGFGPTHFAHDGHWSPLGHELAGRKVAEWLRGQGIGE